ncbi:MAG: helix-turn-helix transcriptional regulator [Planctomycetaceae bacterium]|nr:helix-turn-helix domain-containing protein [Planctomycetaceae bacterium]
MGVDEAKLAAEIGDRIKESLGRIKQAEFSRALGYGTSAVSLYLAGQRPMPLPFFFSACEFLNVSAEWLLTGQGPKRRGSFDWSLIDALSIHEEARRVEDELALTQRAYTEKAEPLMKKKRDDLMQRMEKLRRLVAAKRELEAVQIADAALDDTYTPPSGFESEADKMKRLRKDKK